MEINAQLVKTLREKTGAGMMDCKRALVENNGDIEAAVEHLRKKGLMDAAKKSSRTAADGLISISVSDDKKTGSIVEFNSETDFVAKNDKFQNVALRISDVALKVNSVDAILSTDSLKEEIDSLIALVGENMTLRRAEKLTVSKGTVATYIHNSIAANLGKIGVLVALESETNSIDKLNEFGRRIAMHIAAANPSYLSSEEVPHDVIAKEKSIIIEQAKGLGKADDIAEKMAVGRVKKFLEEIVLVEQMFVMDNKSKVSDVVEAFSKEIGSPVKITKFVKFILGEGIEKIETNFAEEVMSFVK